MPRIKDYPKYEDHVDKTMTWDKKNKMLLPPGRTKLLQDGRFIFDMDDGTYTVSMQYFIENVLGLVNKKTKTIVSDIRLGAIDNWSHPLGKDKTIADYPIYIDIYREKIDSDGSVNKHKTLDRIPLSNLIGVVVASMSTLTAQNIKETINNQDDFIDVSISYSDKNVLDDKYVSFKIPIQAICGLKVSDGKLAYRANGKDESLDLTGIVEHAINNSGTIGQKVQDLVDFRMSPMTPLINSAICSIEVSDAGNMHWQSYDGNTTNGSFDFGALISKKVAEAKPADLPTDLTRNMNITDSGDITWTVNGENKSINLTDSISNRIRGPITRQVDALSQKVNHAPVNFNIDESGNTTWLSNGEDHKFDIGSLINSKVDDKLKSLPKTTIDKYVKSISMGVDGTFEWVTGDDKTTNFSIRDIVYQSTSSMSTSILNLESSKADQSWVTNQISGGKFAKELNVNSSGVMTWTSSDGEKHSVDLKSFVSSSSVESISSSTIQEILKG